MPNQFRLYRFLLRLYPKSFRQKYGDQMIQTLSDMLEDQPDQSSRFLVWLRVSSELPFSIVQQNITNLGENPVHKLAFVTNKKLMGIFIVFVAIIIVFTLHTFVPIRTKIVPGVTGIFYRSKVNDVLEKQNQLLGKPMTEIYASTAPSKTQCYPGYIQNIHVQVDCQATYQAYTKLPQDDTGKQHMLATIKTTEASLANQGYHHGSNGVTLTSLVNGTYQGKDYSPDAFYEKVIGSYDCILDTFIAYSNPQQPAINSMFMCVRTVNVFGASSSQTYQSSKGVTVYN
jgi:hypothetical protein